MAVSDSQPLGDRQTNWHAVGDATAWLDVVGTVTARYIVGCA
jgi:hypothetical protein